MAPNLLGRYNFFWWWPDDEYHAFLTFFIFPIIYRRNIIFWKIFKKSMISDHMAQKYENLENDRIFKRNLLVCFIMLNDGQINMISTHWAQKRNYARFWAQYPIFGWQKFRSDQTSRIDEQQFCLTWFILCDNIMRKTTKPFSHFFCNINTMIHPNNVFFSDGFFINLLPGGKIFCGTFK